MEFNVGFTKNELCAFLMHKGVEEDDAKKLLDEKVDGETFQDITETDLREIGVKLGTRKKIMKIIHNFKQTVLENGELQDLQILSSDSNLSNSLVFDLIAAGSSCTVLPTVSSTVSLATSVATSTNSVPSTSDTPNKKTLPYKRKSYQKKSSLSSSFLSELLPERKKRHSSIEDLCTNEATEHAISTYADPKNINVLAMMYEHTSGKRIMNSLKSGNGISRNDISEVVRIVVRGMIDDLRTLYPTSTQKLNLAKAVVRDIPELKSNREGVAGYEQFYDPKTNAGSIEWRLKTLRVRVPALKKKSRRRTFMSSKPQEANEEDDEEVVIDDEALEKINELKSLPVAEIHKEKIFEGMKETFHARRNLIIKKHASVEDILEGFPKFKEFDGALIDVDFKLIHPNAENLFEVFPKYSEKIIIYVTEKRQDISDRIGNVADENLKAMMYLADLLPIPGMKKRKLDDDRPSHPSDELIMFSNDNSVNLQEGLTKYPCLLCCGEIQDEVLQFFLVLEKEFIDLGKCFVKAFDILYKSYKVFNVDYPPKLVVFYSFIDTMIYKVNTGVARSSVEHLHNIICCVNTNG